jgi:MGT family glycosyltransferase
MNIGLFCPPLPGHLNPVAILGRALVARGHRVIAFQMPALEQRVRAAGLDFHPLGKPSQELSSMIDRMGRLSGLASLRFAVQGACTLAELICREGPAALSAAGVDLVLVDQNDPAGGTIAEHLKIPFLNVSPSLPLNREPSIPPPFVPWSFSRGSAATFRNRVGYALADRLIAPITTTLNRFRRGWGLTPVKSPNDSFSHLGQLFQMPREFDFPRAELPPCAQYLGPFLETGTSGSDPGFPFEKLDGRPLIYASFGTLQSGAMRHFQRIAEGCASLDVQVVIATGQQHAELPTFPNNAIVVPWAPQIDLLSRAALTITHAGMNTTMQSLSFGVPMLAIPMTHDQPAIAARIGWTGTGIVLQPGKASADRVQRAVRQLLEDPQYRKRAIALREAIRHAGGVERAADIVESAVGVRRRAAGNR